MYRVRQQNPAPFLLRDFLRRTEQPLLRDYTDCCEPRCIRVERMHMRVVQTMRSHRARNSLRSGRNVLHDLLRRTRWQRRCSLEEVVSEEVE